MSAAHDSGIVVESDVRVPMRDGVALATDIYLPEAALNGRPLPVLIERTPYDRQGVSRAENSVAHPESRTRPEVAERFARRGYVVVMQDCRGRYASEGHFTKYVNEPTDGYDTLAWLVEQPWCNGRIGTMGLSYGAHVQTAMAALNPPGLKCMFIDSGGFSNAFQSGVRQGGAFEMKQATWAFRHAKRSPLTAADPKRKAALEEVDITAWMRRLDWAPGNTPLSAAPEFEEYLLSQWSKDCFDEYWHQPGLYATGFYDQFPDIPIAILGSWYDPYVATCIKNYRGLSGRQSPVRLIMGPWTHGNRSQTWAGDVDFGERSTLDGNIAEDYETLRTAWFDQHLGDKNDSASEPLVSYFLMGSGSGERDSAGRLQHGGQWQQEISWPPTQSIETIFYLHGSGELALSAPTDGKAYCEYLYDPNDPVPTIGGAVTSGAPVMYGGAFDQVQTPDTFAVKSTDRRIPLANRDDVIVFETAPLKNELIVAGPVIATLWVSTDQPDTDFTIKLLDVYPPSPDYPEGFAMNITDGVFRLRYREGWESAVAAEPGNVYRITIKAFDTANCFAVGHRLRVDVSSSNYPHFDVNSNHLGPRSGNALRVAKNRIYCDTNRPSQITLHCFGHWPRD